MKTFFLITIFLISFFVFSQDSLVYFNKKINVSFKKNDFNQSDSFFQKKLNYLKHNDNLEEYLYAHFDYFLLDAKTERLTILTNAVDSNWRSANTNNEHIAHLHLLVNIAYHENKFGRLNKAISFGEKTYYYFTKNKVKNYDIVENCLKRLGNNYLRIDDYTKAEEVYKNTIHYLEKNNITQHLIATYLHLSNSYSKTNQFTKANEILLKLKAKSDLTKEEKNNVYLQLASNYLTLNDIKNCELYLEKSHKLKSNNAIIIRKTLLLKAATHIKKEQFNIALKSFVSCIKITEKIYGKNSRELAKLHLKISEIHFYTKNHTAALKNYQIALEVLIPILDSTKNNEQLTNSIYAENTFIDIFEGKAVIFEIQKKYQNAIDQLLLASNVSNRLNELFTDQQSKIIQQTENRNRTERIVLLYYKLYQKTKNNHYLENSFLAIEKNKAKVLNDELFIKKHLNISKNDTLFTTKKILKKQISSLQKELLIEELKGKNANINHLKTVLSKKTSLQSKLFYLQEKIDKKYPSLNKIEELTVAKIQEELLTENQLLISYFKTKSNWFIFSLDKTQQLQFRILENDKTLESEINNYINFFFNGNDNLIKNDISAYQKTAFYLYQKLIEPELKSPFEYLTIIPDKKLNFIAFDGLLTQKITNSNFANFPYLIKKVAINSSFSTNILWLQKQQNKKSKTDNFVGYFPVFKNNKRNLQHLPYTLKEQTYFNTHTNGLSYVEENATKQHFLSHFKEYKNIHLSTHASAGSLEQPAVIEFYDETLYLPEIYGLDMQSDLLVLSACETGVGKMQKGEGVMSLARGFTYAGVDNLIASLWKVNDKATSELMRNFYKNLKTNSKTKALQQAKIDYLENESISSFKKSPYYWSSFVFVGNVGIESTNYMSFYVIISALVFCILLFFLLRKK